MNAPALLAELAAAGIAALADDDGLVLRPASRVPPGLLAECRRLKPELLALLRSEAANGNTGGLLPLTEIIGLVEGIAGADPIGCIERVREAACRMRRAGHCRAEIAATLLPAVPLATPGMAALLALEDGLADAVGCEP